MKRKVLAASLKEAPSIHPLSGDSSLNSEKMHGIEMWTGIDNGFLTVFYKGSEVGVPLSNVKCITWDKEECK